MTNKDYEKIIEKLTVEIADLKAIVATLTLINSDQAKTINELKERLNMNSKNSSKPPSSDGPFKPNPKSLRKSSGKTVGAQVGHKGSGFKLFKEPDEEIKHKPIQCENCPRSGECVACGSSPTRYETDIIIQTKLTAHSVQFFECPLENNREISGEFPENINGIMQYGVNISALAVALNTAGMMGIKRTHDILSGVFDVPISTGTISSMVKKCAAKLSATVEKIGQTIAALSHANFDETGVRADGKLHWLHSSSNALFTHLSVSKKRGVIGMEEGGVLPNFTGVATHDCWAPYFKYDNIIHSICNAHLLRELTSVFENYESQNWAKSMINLLLEMKNTKENFIDNNKGNLTTYFQKKYIEKYDKIIDEATTQIPKTYDIKGKLKRSKPLALINRFLKYKDEICRFIFDFKTPFDNNQAERDVRMVKVKQKVSGGFRTLSGAEDFAIIMSYLGTANKHVKNSYLAIVDAIYGLSDSVVFLEATE